MNKTFGLRALRRICATRLSGILAVIFAVAYLASVTARAGVTISLYLDHNGNAGSPYYLMFANIGTNALTPMPANTLFYIWSPNGSTNSGVHAEMDSTGYSADGSAGNYYGTYQSLISDVTNEWTLMTLQGTTTNFYSFSFSGFTSNDFPEVTILYPVNNALGVSFSPDFSWTLGPTNYTQLYVQVNSPDYSDDFNANLSLNQTNWQTPGELREGTNDNFSVSYNNFSSGVTSSVPVSAASDVFPGWASTSELTTYNDSQFTPGVSGNTIGHTLIAHYTFDNSGFLGQDSSTNGNDLDCYSTWGGGISQTFNTNAEAGAGAAEFYGDSGMTPCDPSQSFTSWSNTLVGSYSISLWINTTNVVGNDGDEMGDYNGQSVFFADNNGNGSIPVGITGHKVAFFTGDTNGNQDTLHSLNSVTTGGYVHVVVTRNQTTGEKAIYVNGTLDSSDFGSTELLTGDTYSSIGGAFASAYVGLVDDVQIYSGVLEPADVTNLFDNPGTTVANAIGNGNFNGALDTTNLVWSTTGDTSWFTETTNTYNGAAAAAQSGSVTNEQSSTLSVTVTGPGTLTFEWSTLDDCENFYCEYDIDGNADYTYLNDIDCSQPWVLNGPYTIPSGQHTLTWTAYAGGDTDPTEAAFLDNVSYVPANLPVIALNPFSQTNYPGYQVWLSAVATNTPGITWQWYKIGPGAILGATTNYFIPTNSGTAGVAGSYYAVATSPSGSTTTTTSAVTFVSAPLPPDWSVAFKSPFNSPDTQVSDYYLACLPDSSGNIYAVGEFQGTNAVQFTNDIATNYDSPDGTYSADIIKQTDTGSLLWMVAITNNGNGHSEAYGVAAAPGGGIYVAGNFNGTDWVGTNQMVDLSQGPYNYTNSVFLARFDANGNNLWVRTISGTNYGLTEFNELVADSAGNVTLSGLFWGSTLFPSTNTATSTNLFATGQQGGLAQYDANGALRWAEITTNWLDSMAYSGGRIYGTIGNNNTSFNFGGINVATSLARSVVALNATNGQAIWVQGVGEPFGQPNPLNANDGPVVAAVGTNVFVVGTSVGSNAAFGSYTVSWPGLANQYFARCDTNGTPQALATFGSSTTFPRSIAANASGVYVSGDFDSFSAFGNDLIAAPIADRVNDFSQGFLAKFDLNGNPLWANEAVSSGEVNFVGSAVASDGVWVSGVCDSGYYPQPEFTAFGTNHVYSDELLYSPISGGSTIAFWSPAGVLAKVTDSVAMGLPVTLSDELARGGNFQFSFTSQADFTHNVLYTTNLVSGNWETYSNVIGDGTVKTITIPLSVFNGSRQGFVRVTTQ